jgi:L-lactate dehydrogenase
MSYNYQQNTIVKRKVAIIGAGFVGSSIAYALTICDLAREIVLIDIDSKKASGEALDIQHGIPYMGRSAVYAGDYTDCVDCDLIVITAGRNRRPGESRLDLIKDNKETMRNVVNSLKKHYTRGAILVISNPVDVLTSLCSDWMGLPKGMVFGSGCLLDTSRLVSKVAEYIQLSTEVVKGFIVGEHGDAQIPIWSRFTVGGISIDEYCKEMKIPWNDEVKNRIAEEVKTMGATIISNKGRTHYGIATCVCSIADAILNQRPTIASVCSELNGEYGLNDIVLSLPSIIGVNGVEHILEEHFDIAESEQFLKTAEKMQRFMEEVDGVKRDFCDTYVM